MSENRIRENNLNDKSSLFIYINQENKIFLLTLNPMTLEIKVNKNEKNNFTINEFILILESSKFIETLIF